jgi:hypothetical protein
MIPARQSHRPTSGGKAVRKSSQKKKNLRLGTQGLRRWLKQNQQAIANRQWAIGNYFGQC